MAIIFGINPIREALESHQVERLIVKKGATGSRIMKIVAIAKSLGVDVRFESSSRVDSIAGGKRHQGIVAFLAGRKLLSIEEIIEKSPPDCIYLVLDRIEDPSNLGAILRSADGAGVAGVFIPKRKSAPLSDVVWKTSAGAVAHVPIAKVANIAQTIEYLKSKGVWVIGTDVDAPRMWYEIDMSGPIAMVLGNEGMGLRRLVKEKCDFLVRLPMHGKVQSLNVSVSAGIILYEALRQKMLKADKPDKNNI